MHKRFSKLLLVVLALALWAGTAFGASSFFSANPATFSLPYIQGSSTPQASSTKVVTITNNDTVDHTLSITTASPLLQVTTPTCAGAGSTVTAGATINCTVAVLPSGANAVTPGANAG